MIPSLAELPALEAELSQTSSPHARALLAGRLLAGTGQLLRCGQPLRPLQLQPADLRGFLAQVDTRLIEADLQRAAEAALEAAFAEGAEQREWQQWTLDALASRDALDAAVVALEPAGVNGRPEELARIQVELARIDAGAPSIARMLVAANPVRRAARDRLAPLHRVRAWWFHARSECDALVALWRDAQVPPPETAHCGPCAEDRARAALAQRPPARCVTEDELWKLDLGELPPPRRRLVHKHASRCGACAQALAAVEVPLFDGAPESEAGVQGVEPVVLARCAQFKVLAFRGARTRVRVVAEPRVQLASVTFQVAAAALRGEEHDLGPTPKLLGAPARVTATLSSGEQVTLELTL